MGTAREVHTATLLPSGQVLVTGGLTIGGSGFSAAVEVYDDLAAGNWTTVTSMNDARESHTATLLPGGNVLVAGGIGASDALTSTEVYDPGADT